MSGSESSHRARVGAGLCAAALALLIACRAQPRTPDVGTLPVGVVATPGTEGPSFLRQLYAGPPATWPAPFVDPSVAWTELGPLPPAPEPDARLAAEVELGRLLFHDGRISGTQQMACASCHAPELGWSDGRTTSLGRDAAQLTRNAPGLLDVALNTSFFWDGRAATLEAQITAVFDNPDEMDADLDQSAARLATSSAYRTHFEAAFGDPEPTPERLVGAIATFVRTLRSEGQSDFDRFASGDADALSESALRGLHLFRLKARCMNCHHGPRFTDDVFHDLGLSEYGNELEDLGRYAVTGDPEDVGRFKTPTLRNVARTAPYMHNGQLGLERVLELYSEGMTTLRRTPDQADDALFPSKDRLLQAFPLTPSERDDLIAFLDALTEPDRRDRVELPQLGDHRSR